MYVYPAVDLMEGKCVRLVKGLPEERIVYGDPEDWVVAFKTAGADYLHLVDLDAALEMGSNEVLALRLIQRTREMGMKVQVGGGVRDLEKARRLLDCGADRIVLGTMALKNVRRVEKLLDEYGRSRIVVAADSSRGSVVVRGWREEANVSVEEMVQRLLDVGVVFFLLTRVRADGTMTGYRGEFETLPSAFQHAYFILAGGIASTDDLEASSRAGFFAAVLGRALFEDTSLMIELRKRRWMIRVD